MVTGIVLNREDGKPLPGSIVRAVDRTGKTLAYRMTDRTGAFSMEVPQAADTVKVLLLGFEQQAFPRPFPSPLRVSLLPHREQIQEAVVTARKVIAAGDTIRYNVNALKRREDLVLGDMLKRLPGVELDAYGYVKYNGQEINRFYIEGKDILENNYNLATRNLSVDAVMAVEVLENHQPYKMLQGVRTSERAAMNILLNEEAKSKVNGGASAGIGFAEDSPVVSASARLSAFYVGKDFSSVDVGGFDNQGNALREPDLSIERDRSYHSQSLQERVTIQTRLAPLEEKRSLFNKTWEASSVNRFSVGKNASMALTTKYGRDARESNVWNRSVYQVPGTEDQLLDRTEETNVQNNRFVGALSFKHNGSKLYVSDDLYADYSYRGGSLSVVGGVDRYQRIKGRGWNLENDASAYFRIGDRVAAIESFTQFSGMKEDLNLNEGVIGQQRDVHLFYQRAALSGISRQLGWWRFSITPEADMSVFHLSSSLAPFPVKTIPGILSGNTALSLFRPALTGHLQYKKSPWSASLDSSIGYSLFVGSGEGQGMATGRLSGRFKYVSGCWEAVLSGGVNKSAPDIQTLGGPVILTGYYTLWKGRGKITAAPQWNVSAEYRYRTPVSGWNLLIKSNFTQGDSFISARELYDGYILEYLTDDTSRYRTLVSGAELSRGLFRSNGKWRITLDDAWSQFIFLSDGEKVASRVHTLSPSGDLSLSLMRWWGMSAGIRYSYSAFLAEGLETHRTHSLTVKSKQAFHFSSAWSGGVGGDMYYCTEIGKVMFFPDVSLTWMGKKGLRLRLEADNLLNMRSYSFVMLSPLLENTFNYRIRPLTVLFGVDWQF